MAGDGGAERRGAAAAPLALLGHLSHELRTPLNAILGYAELVRDELEERGEADLARDVDRIREAAGGLAVLLDKVLDLAQLEMGLRDVVDAPLDLVAEARATVEELRPQARRHGNRLELLALIEPLPMRGDPYAVRRVLREIVENACRFTRDGEVRVEVDRAAGRALVRVADTGAGVPEAEQIHLFEAFYRAPAPGVRPGPGLGLAVARRLCEHLGGTIRVESRLGEGSTFTVEFPLGGAGARPRPG